MDPDPQLDPTNVTPVDDVDTNDGIDRPTINDENDDPDNTAVDFPAFGQEDTNQHDDTSIS
jgi:hypothetical protein